MDHFDFNLLDINVMKMLQVYHRPIIVFFVVLFVLYCEWYLPVINCVYFIIYLAQKKSCTFLSSIT